MSYLYGKKCNHFLQKHLTGLDKTAIDFHFRNWFHFKNTYTHTVIVCLIHDAHTYGYIIYVIVGRYALKMP